MSQVDRKKVHCGWKSGIWEPLKNETKRMIEGIYKRRETEALGGELLLLTHRHLDDRVYGCRRVRE
jgi:hypothetical protein